MKLNRGDSYLRLVERHPLRSIRSETELDAAQAVMDDLLRREPDEGELGSLAGG